MMTELCATVPTAIKIVAHPAGFSLSLAGRPWITCTTVRQVWAAIFATVTTVHAVFENTPDSPTSNCAEESTLLLFRAIVMEAHTEQADPPAA